MRSGSRGAAAGVRGSAASGAAVVVWRAPGGGVEARTEEAAAGSIEEGAAT